MYLSELKLWNFRKFGSNTFDRNKPNLVVPFQKGLNLLVGENDSGKTAIIDAIRIVLGTNNLYERHHLEIEDFFAYIDENGKKVAETLRIECIFHFEKDSEAKNFLEWGHFDKNGNYILRLFLEASQRDDVKVLPYETKGGIDDEGLSLNAEVRELLKATYLKPLRDADTELQPKRNSRLSQILASHKFAKEQKDVNGKILSHPLVEIIREANEGIKYFFTTSNDYGDKYKAEKQEQAIQMKQDFDTILSGFADTKAHIDISKPELRSVLEKLMLNYDVVGKGLGSQNLLFIAVELLLLERDTDFTGLRLALIEEIEAHLYPQAQMRLVEYLQAECKSKNIQMLLTTHSPNLASKVKLENLIICQNNYAYPMSSDYTMLEKENYAFLERFLDVTKANLFFAKGVILVEGDAENLLLPTLAKIIGYDLTKHKVSIINLRALTFKHYERIFIQKNKQQSEQMNIPVSVITDVDTKVWEYYQDIDNKKDLDNCYEINAGIISKINTDFTNSFDGLIFDINNAIFDNFDNVLDYFRSYLKAGKKRLPNKFPETLKGIIQIRKITRKELSDNQKNMKIIKEKDHSPIENVRVKGFVNSHWTLEYELALSCLRKEFYTAILMAKELDYFDIEILEEKLFIAKAKIRYWKNCKKMSDEEIAYNIYWLEMIGKEISKAIVAQFFAEILESKTIGRGHLEQIKKDRNLKYLIEAIKHSISK